MLEHMVDTVLFLEGESGEGRRWECKGSWVHRGRGAGGDGEGERGGA